ncbi:glutamate racemase [Marinomonas sp. C2222]|uniref:Glutamate racemase n=1 Tax=Marinomonas sargassi TaxID=2984494 RepID=A0ABT2YSK7_9GAMM|nr:glutamate racemase [Marinomonas sargassi]MCV2402740.1 glutamate racemase [Marinomonas sargassi]
MKVGVLDSGAGGLSILNSIQQKLPYLDLVYLADEAFAPYGDKSIQQLQNRLVTLGRFFQQEGVSAIVVACNTATVVAIDKLRESINIPIIGVEPAVKPACYLSKERRVAVLATPVTANSARLKQLIEKWQNDSYVTVQSSESLAYDIDAWPDSRSRVTATIEKLATEMQANHIDALVLACTHYPLVKAVFESVLGTGCEIIEPSLGVAAQLLRRLEQELPEPLLSRIQSGVEGRVELCSTKGLVNIPRLQAWVAAKHAVSQHKYIHIV